MFFTHKKPEANLKVYRTLISYNSKKVLKEKLLQYQENQNSRILTCLALLLPASKVPDILMKTHYVSKKQILFRAIISNINFFESSIIWPESGKN